MGMKSACKPTCTEPCNARLSWAGAFRFLIAFVSAGLTSSAVLAQEGGRSEEIPYSGEVQR